MKMSDDYRKSLSEFIAKYVYVKDGYQYDEDDVIEEAIGELIREGVFSVEEMQKEALRKHSIIIPGRLIKYCACG